MRFVRPMSTSFAPSAPSSSSSPWGVKFNFEQARLWWANVPLCCRGVAVACTVVSLLTTSASCCLSAGVSQGLFHLLYSFVLSVFKHDGILHWLFNMLALFSFGPDMELLMGTSAFAALLTVLTAAANLLFMLLESIGVSALGWFKSSCVVGFSGVLFALMAFDCWHQRNDSRETLLFGVVAMKMRWAPVALLLLFALFMPGSSFVMHLAGLVAGVAVVLALQHTNHSFLKSAAVCGRDCFCSRCRHYEEGPTPAPCPRSQLSDDAPHTTRSAWAQLPLVAPKGYEAFQGSGRRLGGGSEGAAVTAEAAVLQTTHAADDVV